MITTKQHEQMPNKKEPWVDRHSANVVRYAVPLIFGDRPHPKDPVHQNLGTGVVVEAGEGAFVVTAAHVLEHAQGRASEPRFHFMVGPVELGLSRVIAVNKRLDIATLRIEASEVTRLENDGVQIVRPFEWPLSRPTIGAPVVIAGFPGDWRTHLSWHELEVGSTTMRGFV